MSSRAAGWLSLRTWRTPSLLRRGGNWECHGGLALHEFRLEHNRVRKGLIRILNALQRLANRCQARRMVGSAGDVIEANYGDVFRTTQTGVLDGAHGTDRRDVIEAEDGREMVSGRQQVANHRIAEFRRP